MNYPCVEEVYTEAVKRNVKVSKDSASGPDGVRYTYL